jgi:hypothetical protein
MSPQESVAREERQRQRYEFDGCPPQVMTGRTSLVAQIMKAVSIGVQ